MKRKQFSIVIPTRERHETLGSTIKTVLNQDYDDYEIIVSDNFSSPDTKLVVDSFNSQKIKYIRSEAPIAMVDNWESALSYAGGEYVIFLGDDDGLIHGALKTLNNIITATDFKVIRWERVYYSWPNMEPVVFANKLHIKYNDKNKIVEGKRLINQVIAGDKSYTHLPMLYNSAVHYTLIKRHKDSTGQFFHSIIPDVYSGFVLAHLSKQFMSLGIPMSINAGSAKSNGSSFMFKKHTQIIHNDFKQLNDVSTIAFDKRIPYVRSLSITLFEPYLQFIKFLKGNEYEFDLLKSLLIIIEHMIIYDKEELKEFIKIILKVAEDQDVNLSVIKEKLSNVRISDVNLFEAPKCGFSNDELVLDAWEFGIKNVFDVSVFVKRFYDYQSLNNIKFEVNELSSNKVVKIPMKTRVRKAVKILYKGTY